NEEKLKYEPVGEPVEIKQSLTPETFAQCEALGRAMAEQLMAAGLYFSEQSVRHKLKQMAAEGLVILSRGRGGTKITPAGIAQISLQFKGDNDKITGNELFGL
ncbi:MAG: hypothetical protein IIY91_03155, partial [Selenomonas sp.]|nr:hypothetical protein [Selenomonas sp.]